MEKSPENWKYAIQIPNGTDPAENLSPIVPKYDNITK